jgi:hypothetical protein
MEHYLATHFSPAFFLEHRVTHGTRVESGGPMSSCSAMSVPFLRVVSRVPRVKHEKDVVTTMRHYVCSISPAGL